MALKAGGNGVSLRRHGRMVFRDIAAIEGVLDLLYGTQIMTGIADEHSWHVNPSTSQDRRVRQYTPRILFRDFQKSLMT
jgi:hypothetical protein